MVTYIIRRLLLVPLLLFGVSILIFGMLQFLDPVERASLYIRGDFKSDAQVEAVVNRYCLNCPIYKQYTNWLVGPINPLWWTAACTPIQMPTRITGPTAQSVRSRVLGNRRAIS